ncbi:helix-turn-helix domain-containing protein [Rhizobium sp. P40RR-XXII]|uniref:helix-turn-helix domain-containing protein n=1 Tax=Rhizobium sp. P40RR-XXII TaxID=2726739 RepID=UPI0014566602|nr:helix-turn-helix domain-containing protein [Rhizobium sp. P40RR-XXII]NLS20418.1 helix-turn-helix domain-containing protein [Rhizobium sp. P40RR-XXII]
MLTSNLHMVRDVRGDTSAAAELSDFNGIFCRQPLEHAQPGQIVFFEGDPAKHVFSLVEGNLRICRLLSDGRRVITGFLRSGDAVGVSFKNRYLYSAEAIDEVTFRRVTKRSFEEELATSPQLRPLVFSRVCDEVAAAQDQMVLLSCKSAEERLASFLLRQLQSDEAHGGLRGVIALPMTRLDIADYLGLTIETVSRTVTKLSSKGIISVCGRHGIKVLSRAGLAHQAAEYEDDDVGNNGRTMMAQRRH